MQATPTSIIVQCTYKIKCQLCVCAHDIHTVVMTSLSPSPSLGPQPGWDPDIVAALEEAEMNGSECGGDLDDDFVLLANSGEPGIPVYVTEETG